MRCCRPIIPDREYEIDDNIFLSNNNSGIYIPIEPVTDVDLLKDKIICEYTLIITELEKGHIPDIEFLLEEISAVDLESELDNREFVLLYYLNNIK